MPVTAERQLRDDIPGRVAFLDGKGDLPMIEVSSAWSTAEIYLNGAHVTHFQKKEEPPLLFMSRCSRFAEGDPIRGGVPIIFPWFGPREGMAQHGFARCKTWALKEVMASAEGTVTIRLRLPDCPEASAFPPFTAEYLVTVSDSLSLQLEVVNNSKDEALHFENCLHTYFAVGDIASITIHGLNGTQYLDKVENYSLKTENNDPLRIASEVDRTYLNAAGTVQVHDSRLRRRIIIEKTGSNSTVVWNPWAAKAHQMPDFGNEEYKEMLCVESGNVASNEIKLAPGQTAVLAVTLRTEPIA